MSVCKTDTPRLAWLAGAVLLTACSGTQPTPASTQIASKPAPIPAAVSTGGTRTEPPARIEVAAPPPAFEPGQAGLAMTPPRGWRTRRRDGALVYEGPMRVPSVAVFPASGVSLDDALTRLPAQISAAITGVRITQAAKAATVAGYGAYVLEGTGRAEGFPMRWRATVVDAERMTVMLALAPSMFWGAKQGAIRSFERSVRRTSVETAAVGSPETPSR